MVPDIENMRKEYAARALGEQDVDADPFRQFKLWFEEAMRGQLPEPNAMTLATVGEDGRPSARIVLLKGIDDHGFVFYTNYQSQKGRQLAENPHASLVFFWHELQRQVRVEGITERLAPEISTRYFQSRPKGSQIGAWASPQSQPIKDRRILESKVEQLKAEYEGAETLPRPGNWGGYILRPDRIEFWQGRPSRLHDRILYTRTNSSQEEWKIERLAP